MFDLLIAYLIVAFGCLLFGIYYRFTDRNMPWSALIALAPVWPVWIAILYISAIQDLRKRKTR